MNSAVQEQVSDLLVLAHNKSEDGRTLLAEKLADVFLSQSISLTCREEDLVNDLIDDLLKNERPSVRHALIESFAATIDLPQKIALRVACGPVDVARRILKENETLQDDDLIFVVEKKGTEHAQIIASRREVSEAVADALVETGDLRVMQIVAENLGAKLSGQSLDVLVEAARLSSLLQKPILQRPELNNESASRLYWWVSHELRRVTLDRFGFGPGRLELELTKVIDDMLSSNLLQKDSLQAMQHLADWLAERNAIKIDYLSQFLRAGHYKLFHIALSRLAQIDLRLIEAILTEKGGRMMAALCRALGIDKGNFISIFLMSRGGRPDEHIVHPKELSGVLATFDRLTSEIARSTIQTWRVDPTMILKRIEESNIAIAEEVCV
ncbi:MAG TPA: hypothetical protein DD400_04125 [Rhodospirillaceae bacterium]|nr:hypothetical protein [Rhodospirillaceae bacterium]